MTIIRSMENILLGFCTNSSPDILMRNKLFPEDVSTKVSIKILLVRYGIRRPASYLASGRMMKIIFPAVVAYHFNSRKHNRLSFFRLMKIFKKVPPQGKDFYQKQSWQNPNITKIVEKNLPSNLLIFKAKFEPQNI